MGKLVLFLFIPLFCHAISIESSIANDPLAIQEALNSEQTSPSSVPFESLDSKQILDDHKNLVSDEFDIPPYFYDSTRFWFDIYTQHPSTHSVLHDKENLAIVYDVLDFGQVNQSELNQFTKAALQVKYVERIVTNYKQAFVKLSNGQDAGDIGKKIEAAIRSVGLELPSKKDRKKFYQSLSSNLRAQTGQKDNIQAGINAFARYEETFRTYFEVFDVPWELRAIPFLESSFNVRARSKVGASGVWQFMRYIGNHFMTIDNRQDGRSNPLMATSSALHLLKQNLKIMGRWDLAIAAYNSGTKHLLRGRRLLESKKKDVSLAAILEHYEHEHIGFASKNFFAEFLALTRALAYKEVFYSKPDVKSEMINGFISLCSIKPSWFFDAMKKYDPYIEQENLHFSRKYLKSSFPRGTILFTSSELTDKRYRLITPQMMKSRYAKNWSVYLKGHSCSSK